MKTALITGIGGQDGTYLASHLRDCGYRVFGTSTNKDLKNAEAKIESVDIHDPTAVSRLIKTKLPDEIYHLAAQFNSSENQPKNDYEAYNANYEANVISTLNILESVRKHSPASKVFYASSAQIFGEPASSPQNEQARTNPRNLYAITKLLATNLCHYYRDKRQVFASVGILFNHESSLRREDFLSKKVVRAAVRIKRGETRELNIGSLEAEVDWGYAKDYVNAMHRILQLPQPEDFVISSGERHTVKEFIQLAFGYLGLDWHKYVVVEPTLIPPNPKIPLFGDNSRLRAKTGWKPEKRFKDLVKLMIDYELASPNHNDQT
ncbi:MAG: GDP-mannose 4,6-dehydratase [Nitrososphaerota archaeon]|nr:GDP-mannose 4,6-dehydratase [Nitrososphaerota archaeon]